MRNSLLAQLQTIFLGWQFAVAPIFSVRSARFQNGPVEAALDPWPVLFRLIAYNSDHYSMSNTEDIESILSDLEDSVSDHVEGALVASGDGFVVADTMYDADSEEIAAMVATTMGVSKRMLSVLGGGEVDQTGIQGEDRNVFLFRAGAEGVLAIVAPEDANVGMINLKARDAAEEIAAQLKRRSDSSV